MRAAFWADFFLSAAARALSLSSAFANNDNMGDKEFQKDIVFSALSINATQNTTTHRHSGAIGRHNRTVRRLVAGLFIIHIYTTNVFSMMSSQQTPCL